MNNTVPAAAAYTAVKFVNGHGGGESLLRQTRACALELFLVCGTPIISFFFLSLVFCWLKVLFLSLIHISITFVFVVKISILY